MALDPSYIVGINLGEVFIDKATGEPLAEGTIEFWKDNDRLTGKPVYQLTGTAPNYTYDALTNPITLSDVGTIVNGSGDNVAVYYYPYDANGNVENYYIVVKNAAGTEQFTREAWPNLTDTSDPVNDTGGKVSNELVNSQFVDLYIDTTNGTTVTFPSTSGSVVIGPGWELVITASASNETVDVSRVALAASINAPTIPSGAEIVNAPYALRLNPSNNITTMTLRQRLNHNPGLWSGGYLSGYLIAKSDSTSGGVVALQYQESTGGSTPQDIASIASLNNVSYTELRGSVSVPASTNSGTGNTGYLDILISLPSDKPVFVSSVQVVGMDQETAAPLYDQQPVQRQIGETFSAYKDSILLMPKDSILSGWQFGVNPWQFSSSTVATRTIAAGDGEYIADQTIVINAEADSLQVGRSTGDDNGSLLIQRVPAVTQGKFAIVQFIDIETLRPYWGQYLSAAVKASFVSPNGTTLKFRVDLIYRTTVPPDTDPITSFATTTTALTCTGYTVVEPALRNNYTLQTGTATQYYDYVFDKFQLPVAGSGGYLGIVMHVVNGALDTGDVLRINEISLVPNEFAVLANPQTPAKCLDDCYYHWFQTYDPGVAADTNTTTGQLVYGQPASLLREFGTANVVLEVYRGAFTLEHPVSMRTVPDVNVYDPLTTAGAGNVNFYYSGSNITGTQAAPLALTGWGTSTETNKRKTYMPTTFTNVNPGSFGGGAAAGHATLSLHYTADARLGVVA